MTTSARELVGWTEQRWTAVQEAVNRTLASTAKCRQVLPKGPELIGAQAVPVPTVTEAEGTTYELQDGTTAPVYLSAELQFDDRHADDEPTILRLIETAAAKLGKSEDKRILNREEGTPRNNAMVPPGLAIVKEHPSPVNLANKDAIEILRAIAEAVSKMDDAGRAGPCGLILANELLTTLVQPVCAGEAPPLSQVEQLIGTNEIVGTSALKLGEAGRACGIVFRIEPPAVDLVHTLLPTVTVLERSRGKTKLSVEEEIALRVLDNEAVIQIVFGRERKEGEGKEGEGRERGRK